jgi:eukaryotic-like serine/threonine-protein kinase
VDETIPQVDGLRLLERADAGQWVGRGEVWRARVTGGLAGSEGAKLPADLPGIGECRVRLLRMPVDEALRARALTVGGDLLALDDPGLVPISSVRKAYDGIALVYGHLPTPSTGLHLLARRRLLSAGEVVTLGVALCWALAHAHDAGVAHGRLRDADVLIGPEGRPVLTGVGVMGVLGAPGDAESDVRALERMLASLLDPASAGAPRVAEALCAASASAAGLAALLAGSAPAAPLRVDERASPTGDQPVGRASRYRGGSGPACWLPVRAWCS